MPISQYNHGSLTVIILENKLKENEVDRITLLKKVIIWRIIMIIATAIFFVSSFFNIANLLIGAFSILLMQYYKKRVVLNQYMIDSYEFIYGNVYEAIYVNNEKVFKYTYNLYYFSAELKIYRKLLKIINIAIIIIMTINSIGGILKWARLFLN